MKNKMLNLLKIFIGLYLALCGLLYFFQEKVLFFPQKLDANYQFEFGKEKFEELFIKSTDGKLLNGLLFKSDKTKGLVFYLHGNAGSLSKWGKVAKTYTNLNYDIFILDYRSYGKSEGSIKSQEQLFKDNQIVYNQLKKRYDEKNIIIIGYSIGTGMAAKLASENKPKYLILEAPYYSLTDVMQYRFPFIPAFILRYKLATNEYLKNCKMPITVFHGNIDKIIYYGSSLKLKEEFKSKIKLITLDKQGHNGITDNPEYKKELKKILKKKGGERK